MMMIRISTRILTLCAVVIINALLHYADAKVHMPFCNYSIHEAHLGNCGSYEVQLERHESRDENRVFDLQQNMNTSNDLCVYTHVCRRIYQIGRIMRRSTGPIQVELSQLLKRCCGNCTKYYQKRITRPLSKLNKSFVDTFDIIYPVYAPRSVEMIDGHFFIPVFNMPSAFYITLQKSEKEMAREVIYSCLRMWPLLTMCLMLSLVAGFIIWITDTWANKEEFPRSFLAGCCEGFWWSFITMTTVGYGDKAPKSLPARSFSIVWILIGITMTSIYIGSLAAEIMAVRDRPVGEMRGMKVGALQYRMYESLMIAQHGGMIWQVEHNNTVAGIAKLMTSLKEKEIDGFLLISSTYYYFSKMVEKYDKYKKMVPDVKLSMTEKTFRGDNLAGGILLKNHDDYHHFRKYFLSNWVQIQGCHAYELNYNHLQFVNEQMNLLEGLFFPFFFATLVMLVVIVCFGGVYEFVRRRHRVQWKKKSKTNEESSMALYD